jgi:hypothetical protein
MESLLGLFVLASLLATSPSAWAKAYFAAAKEMVEQSVAIAIVEIESVKAVEEKGSVWTYRERAQAKVQQQLKGSLPGNVQLFGQETFICAQVRFQPGCYLVFLKRDGDKLVGANWHLSVRPIRDGQVEWFSGKQRLGLSRQPLANVLEQVRTFANSK